MKFKKITMLFLIIFFCFLSGCGDQNNGIEDGDLDLDSDGEMTENEDEDVTEQDLEPEEDTEEPDNKTYATLTIENNKILLQNKNTGDYMEMLPVIIVEDQFFGAGENGDCTSGESFITCPAGDYGTITATVADNCITTEFKAIKSLNIEGIILKGEGKLSGATSWLSNGFQSWSQSGILKLAEPVDYAKIHKALTVVPASETLRQGQELSRFFSFAGGGEAAMFAGVTDALIFQPWVSWGKTDSGIKVLLGNGGAGEEISLSESDTITGEKWFANIGTDLEQTLIDYGKMLPTRRNSHPHQAQIGWNSWYDLWYFIEQNDILENAPIAKQMLTDYIPENQQVRIVVDDGWQKKWGEWEADEGFSLGMKEIADRLKNDDMLAGIWLAPVLVSPDSDIVKDHPDWFVGNGVPEDPDVYYTHEIHGKLLVLDVTHPQVVEHIKGFISQIVEWGYSLLKIDFLFAAALEGRRYNQVTGMQAYNSTLQIIREAAGDDTILLAVGSPPIPTSKYADAWRLGSDIAWYYNDDILSWHFAVNQARCISAHWFICYSMLCDADPALLRVLDKKEVEFGSWVAALAGGFMFLSDDLRELDEDRKSWGLNAVNMEAGLFGQPSIPEYFFPDDPPETLTSQIIDMASMKNNHVLPQVWKTPNGKRVFFNLSNDPVIFEENEVQGRSVFVTE